MLAHRNFVIKCDWSSQSVLRFIAALWLSSCAGVDGCYLKWVRSRTLLCKHSGDCKMVHELRGISSGWPDTFVYLCKHSVYTVGLQDGAGHLKWVAGHACMHAWLLAVTMRWCAKMARKIQIFKSAIPICQDAKICRRDSTWLYHCIN